MFEKVNPAHPDKVADRIAGALVDLAPRGEKIAVEVLIGHGICHIIVESSYDYNCVLDKVKAIVKRISGLKLVDFVCVPQDKHLADNQATLHCGDNGIFKGTPVTKEQRRLINYAKLIYAAYPTDGKYILDGDRLIVCQSNCKEFPINDCVFNPLGYWTGGTDTDTGATNRKLGSDMGDSVTGGGLHGKDLSKADVSVNIVCWLLAQEHNTEVTACCTIGDDYITFSTGATLPYDKVVEIAGKYIDDIGGFEKFAEWGLLA